MTTLQLQDSGSESSDDGAVNSDSEESRDTFAQPAAKVQPGQSSKLVWGSVLLEETFDRVVEAPNTLELLADTKRDDKYKDFDREKAPEAKPVSMFDQLLQNAAKRKNPFGSIQPALQQRLKKVNVDYSHLGKQARSGVLAPLGKFFHSDVAVVGDMGRFQLITALTQALDEEDSVLLTLVLDTLGKERTMEFFTQTADIESSGGLMTADGSRRRTPGGVLFHVIRHSDKVTGDEIRAIFVVPQAAAKKEFKKQKRRQKAQRSVWERELAELEAAKAKLKAEADAMITNIDATEETTSEEDSSSTEVGQEEGRENLADPPRGVYLPPQVRAARLEVLRQKDDDRGTSEEGEVGDDTREGAQSMDL